MEDVTNAAILILNFLFVPGLTYGCQLALGALGVTLVYGILRFSNFAHGETMSFGAMICILVMWWLQSLGVSIAPLPTATKGSSRLRVLVAEADMAPLYVHVVSSVDIAIDEKEGGTAAAKEEL